MASVRTALARRVSPWFQRTVASRPRVAPRPWRSPDCAQVGDGLLVDGHRLRVVAGLERDPPGPDQQVGALGVPRLAQLDGLAVVGTGPVQVEVDGPVPGQDQEAAGRLDQLVDPRLGLAGRPGVGERLAVVVGDDLGQVPDPLAGHRLDPLGDRLVAAGPARPRDLGVGDVPDQGVPEHVLVLVLDRGGPRPLDELLALQLGQGGLDRLAAVAVGPGRPPSMAATAPGQKTRPTTAASWTSALTSGARVSRRAAISPCTVSGTGMSGTAAPSPLGRQALVGEQARELLGVQGVAAGPLQQQGLDPDGQHRPAHQGGHQPRRLQVGQRPQRDPGRRRAAVAPARVPFQQLGAGRGHDQQGQAGGALDQVLEELEHRRVGPVQVLDHQHQRVVAGHGLHEPAPGGEQLGPLGLDRVRAGDPEQRGQPRPQPLALRRVGEEAVQGRPELARHLGRWVGLEDAGLGLDDLAQRPEGDPVAIGQAAALAPDDQLRPVVRRRRPARRRSGTCRPPGSPTTVTSRTVRSARVRSNSPSSRSSSAWRPTKGVPARRTASMPVRLRAPSSRHTGTGSALPFTRTAPSSS